MGVWYFKGTQYRRGSLYGTERYGCFMQITRLSTIHCTLYTVHCRLKREQTAATWLEHQSLFWFGRWLSEWRTLPYWLLAGQSLLCLERRSTLKPRIQTEFQKCPFSPGNHPLWPHNLKAIETHNKNSTPDLQNIIFFTQPDFRLLIFTQNSAWFWQHQICDNAA